jgi:chaperone BCS1
MDVWVNFKHATKWQAEGIFKCFFPFKPSQPSACSSPSSSVSSSPTISPSASTTDLSQRNLPGSAKPSAHAIPLLEEEELDQLAKQFAKAIPEDEFSVASLQGYLLKNKTRPRECVGEVEKWIKEERETREKLKKQKEEVSIILAREAYCY